MVSLRCKLFVKNELEVLGLEFLSIELGCIELREELTEENRKKLNIALLKAGLEIMDNKKAILIEKIKNIITEMIHYSEELPISNFSNYLAEKLGQNYPYLSNTFSEVKGITIEQYIILHKIERVKELLLYNELNLTEISYKLHYSSVAHLSSQFKKVTGLTPTFFKQLAEHRNRNSLEDY